MISMMHRLGTWLGLGMIATGCSGQALAEQRLPIRIDGSSTVYPITGAIADRYQREVPNPVKVDVAVSGTSGGFQKFCAGETEISNASRPITTEEIAACDAAGIRYYELPVAFDALTVVINPQNTWVQDITLAELKTLWQATAQGSITQWNQIRPTWPAQPIQLYGPGLDSGTYDYFTEVVVGGDARTDVVVSEDDEVLAQGVADHANALGYFGLAYYQQHQDTLKAVAIDGGKGAIAPTVENVVQAKYNPLARPLFIYVSFQAAQENIALREFVEFYLAQAPGLVSQVGYVPLPEEGYHIAEVNFQEGEVGTAFDGAPQPNLTIGELLRKTKRF